MTCSAAIALSMHLFAGDWNEVHPSVRCDYGNWAAGAFYNSERRISLTAGYVFTDGTNWATIGIAAGYEYAPIVPFIRVGREIIEDTHIFVVPTLKPDTEDLGFVLGIERRF